jgi:C4-dicarboxylate transporter DctQ subunit
MLLNIWDKFEERLIAFLLVFMTLLVFLDVVMRFGFGTGFLWTQELTLYTSAWFVLFGISYGLKVGAHIGVDAVLKLVPPNVQKTLSAIAAFLCICYCFLFIYGSWVYLTKVYMIGITVEDIRFPMWFANNLPNSIIEAWHIDIEDPLLPLWMPQSILMFGMALFSIRLMQLFFNIVTGKSDGFHHIDEAKESLELAKKLSFDEDEVK